MEFEIDTEFIVQTGKYALVPLKEHEKTTSQQHTIERLREALKSLISINNSGSDSKLQDQFKKAEQLLNTTEPIDQ